MGLKIGGWAGGLWERNRDAAGKTLKAVAPLAAFIPGVNAAYWAALAGAGAGALGTAAQRGTNIGDIAKGGALGAASAASMSKLRGTKLGQVIENKAKAFLNPAEAPWNPMKVDTDGAGGGAGGTPPVPWFKNPAVISSALESAAGMPKSFAEAEQARATAARTRGATALDAYALAEKRRSDTALDEMLKRLRSGGM